MRAQVNYSFDSEVPVSRSSLLTAKRNGTETMRLEDWQQGLVFSLGGRQKVKACYSFGDQSVCYFWVEFAEGQSECPMTFRIGDREALLSSGSLMRQLCVMPLPVTALSTPPLTTDFANIGCLHSYWSSRYSRAVIGRNELSGISAWRSSSRGPGRSGFDLWVPRVGSFHKELAALFSGVAIRRTIYSKSSMRFG